jgi:hypothetical protein
MSRLRVGLAVLTGLAVGTSCAHQMGKNASQGFIEGVAEQRAANPDAQPIRQASERAVAGAFEALSAPEQQAALRALVASVAEQAAASTVAAMNDPRQRAQMAQLVSSIVDETVTTALESGLSSAGGANGPAARLAGEVARAATRDAMAEVSAGVSANLAELFPGCKGNDVAACRRQHLRALTHEAGAGFMAGALESVRWLGLLAAGLVGLLIGLFVHWLWTLRPHHPAGPLVSINGGRGLHEAHGRH